MRVDKPLGDVADITAGPSGSLLEQLDDRPDGVPVISPTDLTDLHRVDARNLRRVPASAAKKLSRFALAEGDVLVVRQGSLGRFALIDANCEGWFYNSSCLRVRTHRELVLPEYLALILAYPPTRDALFNQALPGTVQSINSEALNQLPVPIVNLELQQKVAAAAFDIDAQIHTYREITERLEVLKPAMLHDFLEKARRHEGE
ncbi:restriction endonuclease subunit S [Amycolatopsis sp. cmx-11-12]|uniref:restriction endonuclease subunit S n=1 Tax=Amycolatopsis sp. cmx-11-12 TaxID=2785795 RepID=UPI00391732EC